MGAHLIFYPLSLTRVHLFFSILLSLTHPYLFLCTFLSPTADMVSGVLLVGGLLPSATAVGLHQRPSSDQPCLNVVELTGDVNEPYWKNLQPRCEMLESCDRTSSALEKTHPQTPMVLQLAPTVAGTVVSICYNRRRQKKLE